MPIHDEFVKVCVADEQAATIMDAMATTMRPLTHLPVGISFARFMALSHFRCADSWAGDALFPMAGHR